MKILIITQYFHPEGFKSNDIAFELARRGHNVDVLCGIPNYPQGHYCPGYGIFKKRKETINGVRIYRAFQLPRCHNRIMLMLNYLSYVICACLDILFFFAFRKYDAIIIHEPSPIFQAIPAMLYKWLRGTPIYLWVLDIWPDAMRSGGGIKDGRLIRVVDGIVKWIYRHCDKILISSQRFTESILSKGDFADKIVYFPNWADDLLADTAEADIPTLPQGFRIMVAGNLGKSQDLDAVGQAMLQVRDLSEVKWIFVGDGSRKQWLDQFIADNQLQDTAFTLGRFPSTVMASFYRQADAMLVALRSGFPHLGMVVPARLQSYMSAARPVLGMIGPGGADIIREADCGYAVPAGDYETLAEVIRQKVLSDRQTFAQKGANGRRYYEQHYKMEYCIDHLERIIGAR